MPSQSLLEWLPLCEAAEVEAGSPAVHVEAGSTIVVAVDYVLVLIEALGHLGLAIVLGILLPELGVVLDALEVTLASDGGA